MIVQIVLVIVTAVQVNSELCPSVCLCYSPFATCTNLFSDVTNMPQETFHSKLSTLHVTGSTRLEMEEDQFLRWNITSLITLYMSRNNITKIWQRAFYSLARLKYLFLQDNRITTLDSQTFYYNTRLFVLDLSRNSITDIHPSTFQENINLEEILLDSNKITSLHPDLFKNNLELVWVNLEDNKITDIHPSTFRNNRRLYNVNLSRNKITSIDPETFNQNRNLEIIRLQNNSINDVHPSTFRNNSNLIILDISRNKISLINPDTFIHNKNLTTLYLQGNNITEISNSLFHGLEQLEVLDLSNNNIQELNPLVFHNTLNSTNRQNHQVSKLKLIHLEQNKIRSFNFELYFPMSRNSDSSNPTFQLQYLNLSSNRLTTLDVASVKWLNQTTAVTDLTGNTWNCDCSVLLEVWRGLKHKLTLHCASPRQLQGKSWDVMEEFCSKVAEDRKSNKSSEAVSTSTEHNDESEVSTQSGENFVVTTTLIGMKNESKISSEVVSTSTEHNDESKVSTQSGGPTVVNIILIVTVVLLVCAIVGGLILAKVVNRLRKRQKTLHCCDVYARKASNISLHSYKEVGVVPSLVTDETYADVGKSPS